MMTATSSELVRGMGIPNTYLHRWERAGLITPVQRGARGGATGSRPAVWPDWSWRMVALLRERGTHPPSTMHGREVWRVTVRLVAGVLAEHPDVPWVVIDSYGAAHACYSAAEVVAVHRGQVCSTVVAIPSMVEAMTS